jgi:hypothetical protein
LLVKDEKEDDCGSGRGMEVLVIPGWEGKCPGVVRGSNKKQEKMRIKVGKGEGIMWKKRKAKQRGWILLGRVPDAGSGAK